VVPCGAGPFRPPPLPCKDKWRCKSNNSNNSNHKTILVVVVVIRIVVEVGGDTDIVFRYLFKAETLLTINAEDLPSCGRVLCKSTLGTC